MGEGKMEDKSRCAVSMSQQRAHAVKLSKPTREPVHALIRGATVRGFKRAVLNLPFKFAGRVSGTGQAAFHARRKRDARMYLCEKFCSAGVRFRVLLRSRSGPQARSSLGQPLLRLCRKQSPPGRGKVSRVCSDSPHTRHPTAYHPIQQRIIWRPLSVTKTPPRAKEVAKDVHDTTHVVNVRVPG